MSYPDAVRRAGHADGERAVRRDARPAARASPSPSTSTSDDFARIATPTSGSRSSSPSCSTSSARCRQGRSSRTTRRVPVRALGGRAPLVHRQRHLPRPGLAQARRDGALRVSARGRRAARPARRRPRADHHRAGTRRGDGRDQRDHAARPRVAAERLRARRHRRRTARRRVAGVAPNALTALGVARPVRRDAVAQARPRADRAGRPLTRARRRGRWLTGR